MNIDERLDRIEKVVLATAEQQAWMIQWIDGKFAQIDKRFAQIDKRFAQIDKRFAQVKEQFAQVYEQFAEVHQETVDTRTYIDLKFESIRSDFRVFRETYLDLSARVKALEARC